MEPNLAESIYIRFSIKFLYFVPFRQQIWPPRAILVSDWLMLNKSSLLKLLSQMEPNLAGSIYVRSSIKLLQLVPLGQQTWPPRAILVSDWLMLKNSFPLKLLGQMEPNLAGSIYVRSSIKLLHLVPFGQQTWPLLLKIEHMVKLHVFGNNSKTINNIRNLTGIKIISTARSNYPQILKKILLPILELLPFFHQIFKILILFVLYFKNYKR